MKSLKTVSVAVGLALWSLAATPAAAAQQPAKVPRIGFLYPGLTAVATIRIAAFVDGLRGMGYVQGQHFTIESRVAEGRPERLPALAAELVRLPVDVVLAVSPAAVQAARAATKTIPIVAHDLETDPIASGLIASYARPGGNITGVFSDFPDFGGKLLELLKEAVPRLSRVAVLWDPATGSVQMKAAEAAARLLGLQLQILEVRSGTEIDEAFRSARKARAGGLLVLSSPVFGGNLKQVAELAVQNRLPAITLILEFGEAGGLMSYGPNINDLFRQAARLVVRVLQGAKPAELPAERPTRFKLVVNLRTAKSLGLTFPPSIMVRATK
jgi:putative ABC transport system substrate-binding protein